MKIVSPNTKDPHSLFKWTVHDSSLPRSSAGQAYRCVEAHGVVFEKIDGAIGFGDGTVAKCADAFGKMTYIATPSHCFRIRIDGKGKFRDEFDNHVLQCSRIFFLNDGTIYAEVVESVKNAVRKKVAAAA